MTDPDRRLARQARRGDRRALLALYERHRGRLLGFLVRATGSRTLAEDVFQEVWIKVLQGVTSYRPEIGSFRSWLFRVAHNAAVDRLRKEARRATDELDAPIDEDGHPAIDLLESDELGPERRAEGGQLGERLGLELIRLPEQRRNAVLLRHQQGLSYPEIATTLGVPEGTAKTLVHRGVLELRSRLKEWKDA